MVCRIFINSKIKLCTENIFYFFTYFFVYKLQVVIAFVSNINPLYGQNNNVMLTLNFLPETVLLILLDIKFLMVTNNQSKQHYDNYI